jgi:acyl carrier protein
MSYAQWDKTTKAKVAGTRNIDRVFGDSLDFLVLLSSIVGVMGNPSQANYAAGGAYQDAVARSRAAKGQAGVSIDLGVVQGVGFVAEAVGTAKFLRESGHKPQSEAEVLALVGQAIRNPRRDPRTAQVTARLSSGRSYDPRFKCLVPRKGGAVSARIQGGSSVSTKLYETIDTAPSVDDAAAAVQQALVEKISDMFVLEKDEIDAAQPLARYGVDSLVAIELRNWLVPSARIEMSIFDFLGSSSLADLAMNVTKRTKTWAIPRKGPLVPLTAK